MSLFKKLETTCNVYQPVDNDTTKKTTYLYTTASFIIDINIIRLNADEEMIFGEQYGTYRANVERSTNVDLLKKGSRIKKDSEYYEITRIKNDQLFNKRRMFLKKLNG